MEGKTKKKIVFLALILLLPSFFYVIFSKGEHHYKSLPFIGPRQDPSPTSSDTVYHTIPDFILTSQDGTEFSAADMLGKIYVVDFFFTRCPTICPRMSAHLMDLQNKFSKYDNVRILSHTVDPDYDSPAVLKDYAARVHADTKKWTFLTGPKEDIYKLAYDGYFASSGIDERAPGGFLHSELVFLVDSKGRLRGSFDDIGNVVPAFDGTSTTEMKELADAVNNLLLEEVVPMKKK